jgi:hypothetical protein
MGMLDDMERDLMAVTRPAPVVSIGVSEPVAPEDTRLIDALTAIREQIAAIEMPELKLDMEKAVKQLITGLSRLKTEHKPVDLAPVIKAIEGVTLTVNMPEVEAVEPCPYTFTIVRNDSGLMSKVVAMPGLEEQKPETTTAKFE